jgi:hemerythrin superfamily protein
MNAIKFLLKEHDKVRRLLADISDVSHKYETKIKLFDDLCQDLVTHETMEQKVWYPRLKDNEKLYDTIKHLIAEEKTAAKEIKEFKKIDSEDKWQEKFVTFKKAVERHANEEEKKLFPQVEKYLTEDELDEIGMEMRKFKEEFSN